MDPFTVIVASAVGALSGFVAFFVSSRVVEQEQRKPVKGECWHLHGWGSVEVEKVTETHVTLRLEGTVEPLTCALDDFLRRSFPPGVVAKRMPKPTSHLKLLP